MEERRGSKRYSRRSIWGVLIMQKDFTKGVFLASIHLMISGLIERDVEIDEIVDMLNVLAVDYKSMNEELIDPDNQKIDMEKEAKDIRVKITKEVGDMPALWGTLADHEKFEKSITFNKIKQLLSKEI